MEPEVDEIFQKLSADQFAIFCGAGLSVNSGLPLATDIIKYILSSFKLTTKETDCVLNSNLPFEAFMETILNETPLDEILKIFELGVPNTNHKFIAQLAKSGFVKNIITTNFDLLIEGAFTEVGLRPSKDYEIFSSEASFQEVDWDTNTIKLIKIHGCVLNKEDIGISMLSVANQTNSIFKRRIIKDFFSYKINKNVLVLGYSCSDSFDISPEIESILSGYSCITFVDHANRTQEKIENIGLKKTKNPFRHFMSGTRLFIDTDKFIKLCWKKLIKTKYYATDSEILLWNSSIDNWFTRASDENSIGFRHHIAARLFYNIGEYGLAISHHQQGIYVAERLGNLQPHSSELANMGMVLNTIGRYSEAKECLEKALLIGERINVPQLVISQTENLGNVHRNLKNYNEAIRLLTKSIELAEKYNEMRLLGTSLGNLILVYNLIGRFSETISVAEKSLKVSYELGNKQAEASVLSSLGIAYFSLGETEKAITHLTKGFSISRLIGDKKSECMVLINLANVYFNTNSITSAKSCALESLHIAKELGLNEITYKCTLMLKLCSV